MSSQPAVLLKRSDGPFYRVHIGQDYEAAAKLLSTQQAFTVCPILIGPSSSLDAANLANKAIQALCKPLKNSWFEAPSADIAAIILLQALSSTTEPEADRDQTGISNNTAHMPESKVCITQKSPDCTERSNDLEAGSEQAEFAHCAESCTEHLDERLWDHVATCSAKDASKAADVRAILTQKLGKINAKRILNSCVATVAKNGHGQKNRVLKANGKLLKLKQ